MYTTQSIIIVKKKSFSEVYTYGAKKEKVTDKEEYPKFLLILPTFASFNKSGTTY